MDASTDLRVFVRVMDRGNFSLAASDLGLTPSAVSKLISRLEDRLGARLLERSTRRLALTPEGETFLTRARRIVADIEERRRRKWPASAAPRARQVAHQFRHRFRPAPAGPGLGRFPRPLSGDRYRPVDHRPVGRSDRRAVRHRCAFRPHSRRPVRPAQDRRSATRDLRRAVFISPRAARRRRRQISGAMIALSSPVRVSTAGAFKTRAGIDVVEVRPRASRRTMPKLRCGWRSRVPASCVCRTSSSAARCATARWSHY